MFKNHLKIAWRSLTKDKMFSVIKIGGFAIGITACLLITLFIKDELSYDQHYKNKDRIYRVVVEFNMDGERLQNVHFQLPFADVLESDFPEIVRAGKYNSGELFGAGDKSVRLEGETQNRFEQGFVFMNQGLLEVLEIPLIQGNSKTALTEPYSIVITKEKAEMYYPDGDALGKLLILDNETETPYKITGVMDKKGLKSHFPYDFLMEIEDENATWLNNNYMTYVLLDENASAAQLEQKMMSVVEKYVVPAFKEIGRDQDFLELLNQSKFKLQPVTDIYLKSSPSLQDRIPHGDIRFIWLFAAIAGFILLLAAINFINLSTAKSANRAKEVGLRKTIGAFRKNLISQFIVESVIYSFLSFIIGVLVAWAILPYFNSIAEKSLWMPWDQAWFLPLILISSIAVGLFAGVYPAFYLSAFKPIKVLKGSLSTGSKSGKLRSGLVVFQFTISIILMIGTLIIYQQTDYILTKDLGYEKDQVLLLNGTNSLGNKNQVFKEQLLQLPAVRDVSISDYLPVAGTKRNGNTFRQVGADSEERFFGQIWRIDYDYIKTLGIKMVEGRDFSRDFASDSAGIIINQKMVKKLGLTDPVGKRITNGSEWTIIGVVKDFHFNSLKVDIEPLSLVIGNSPGMISVKLHTERIGESIASVQEIWDQNVPNQSFQYTFLDQDFATMHKDVKRMGTIFNSFALLAIFIACLGLFALSAFMVEQRKKEISIRLVLGASFKNIYELLTVNFLKLILLSIVIAVPIGWLLMRRWLEDFSYRIELTWDVFAMAGVVSIAVAILTISYQSIGAALIKPLKSLRTE